MPKINILDKNVSELIAAGEVIERPASIVKELLENSVDAGATSITIEIKRGGKQYIRVTDNGCGISAEDAAKAFLRHATSKIQIEPDLEQISTLGFRGEALASICAVSKTELITKMQNDEFGTKYAIWGGQEQVLEPTGCPEGTTIIVRDLFYNVPVRLKFLKKDVTEGNAIQSIVDKIALSHPEISIKLIRENKRILNTPGNGDRYSVIHAVFGREFAQSLTEVDYQIGGVPIKGFISIPMMSRANRAMQHFFINGRYIKSKTCCTALEEAYKGSIMVGKFPACVLNIELPFDSIDVNVHPSKIEVRFSDEHAVFEAVYLAVKNAITLHGRLRVEKEQPPVVSHHVERIAFQTDATSQQTQFPVQPMPIGSTVLHDSGITYNVSSKTAPNTDGFQFINANSLQSKPESIVEKPETSRIIFEEDEPTTAARTKQSIVETEPLEQIRIIGELFKTYILAQVDQSFVVVDKHAAHERILYENLKSATSLDRQVLLTPFSLTFSIEEHGCILNHLDTLQQLGFLAEDFGNSSVLIRETPVALEQHNSADVFEDIVNNLMKNKKDVSPKVLDQLYHSMACKAAIKANDTNNILELEQLFRQVYFDDAIRYCPHGRPVIMTFTKERFEKQFGRT